MQPHPFRVTTAVSVLSPLPLCSAAIQNPTPPKQLMGSHPESLNVPLTEIDRRMTSVHACSHAGVTEQEQVLTQDGKGGSPSSGRNFHIQPGRLSSRILTACNKACTTESPS